MRITNWSDNITDAVFFDLKQAKSINKILNEHNNICKIMKVKFVMEEVKV